MRRNSLRKIIPLTVILAALFTAPPVRAAGSCTSLRLPVTLGAGMAQTVAASLCAPAGYAGGVRRVDVLVHGGTYNSTYWDWPLDRARYSYVRKTTDAGRAAFVFDRPGAGAGTRPASASLTVAADAAVLHQLVQWLRGRDFDQVTLIGHSLGSAVSIYEAAYYTDADRLVVTGLLHPPGEGAPLTLASFYSAMLDPKFAGEILDPGYLTTLPGTRQGFYYQPGADPAVIAADDAAKDVMSGIELDDAVLRAGTPPGLNITNLVRIPVLVMIGQNDQNFCGGVLIDCSSGAAIRANQAPYYTSAPNLTGAAVPNTGHSLTLHRSAEASFAVIDQWISSH